MGRGIRIAITICLFLAGALYAAAVVYASQDQVAERDVNAQTLSEINSRNQMLTAKSDMWNNGTTDAMVMCPDGAYIAEKASSCLILEGGRGAGSK